jgi:hypothetical protein
MNIGSFRHILGRRALKMRLAACLVFILPLNGLTAQESEKAPEPWANKLFGGIGNLNHDFGVVCKGTQLRHEFQVTNIYKVPIEISKISYASGVMQVKTDKEVLQPNKKAAIILLVDTEKFKGTKTATFYVTFGPSVSTAELTWTAAIR